MINDEDTTCLMADPLSRDVAFGELLLWSLAGHIPPRYQPYAAVQLCRTHDCRRTDRSHAAVGSELGPPSVAVIAAREMPATNADLDRHGVEL